MEEWMNLIEAVDSTSGKTMCYLVALIELPDSWCFGRYDAIENTSKLKCFFTPEETIQFLSDKEVFGWNVRRWNYHEEWNNEREMRIELFRKGGSL